MAESNTYDIKVYVTETIYTTLKNKAARLGISMSLLIKSYIIDELDRQVLENTKGK